MNFWLVSFQQTESIFILFHVILFYLFKFWNLKFLIWFCLHWKNDPNSAFKIADQEMLCFYSKEVNSEFNNSEQMNSGTWFSKRNISVLWIQWCIHWLFKLKSKYSCLFFASISVAVPLKNWEIRLYHWGFWNNSIFLHCGWWHTKTEVWQHLTSLCEIITSINTFLI